jgi:hypothetical protein
MVLYQICVFGADLKSNMAARVHNVFSAEWFQRRRLKCEKLMDDRRQVMAKAHIAFGKVC